MVFIITKIRVLINFNSKITLTNLLFLIISNNSNTYLTVINKITIIRIKIFKNNNNNNFKTKTKDKINTTIRSSLIINRKIVKNYF